MSLSRRGLDQAIARILKDNGIIDQPLIFRLYSKVTNADGKYQPGTFSLTPNMGYQVLIDTMKTGKPREVVSVVIPEGFTLNKIADRLEENQVCTRSDFFRAANTVMYEYDFLKDLPTDEERIYPLEGYLFPDTYEFYTNSSGETVVRKFLDNFNARVDTSLKAAIKARGMTIDQAVILASIIQGEAADTDNMNKVSPRPAEPPRESRYLSAPGMRFHQQLCQEYGSRRGRRRGIRQGV